LYAKNAGINLKKNVPVFLYIKNPGI
jgi:hypothetical protein